MIFLFSVLAQSLKEVDCKNFNNTQSCSYKCYTAQRDDEATCYDETKSRYCANPRPYYLVTLVCVWLPAIVMFIVRQLFLKSMKPPIFSYFWDAIITFLIVSAVEGVYCMVPAQDLFPINFPLLAIGFIGLPVMWANCICTMCTCCCEDENEFPDHVKRLINEKIYEKAAAETIISEARKNPPVIQLVGNQHIYHRRHKNSWTEIVPVEHDTVPYETWEERGDVVPIPMDAHIINVRMKINVYKSAQIQDLQIEKLAAMENLLKKYDKYSTVESDYVDKFVDSFLASIDNETPCCVSFTNTCFGTFLYYLCTIFGFRSFYETLWCFGVAIVDVKLMKYVDNTDQYRAKSNEQDEKANTYSYEQVNKV